MDLLIQSYPPAQIADSAIVACEGTVFHSSVLGSVLEHYCIKGSFLKALEIYKKGTENGLVLSIRCCNSLLGNLEVKNETRLAWGLYGNMLRNEILPDRFTWSLLARLLCKDGKLETIVRILNMGIYNSLIYNLVIDSYSKKGAFKAAFHCLNEMHSRKVDPSFSTYSSILDGACKFGDDKVIDTVICLMSKKGLLPMLPITNYDLIVRKLSELERTYAMIMFLNRACEEKIEFNVSSYGYMLMAFSKNGRTKEAILMYHEIVDRDIIVNDNCYNEFVNVLCDDDPSEEISGLLKDLIGRGISPCVSKLSDFVSKQCDKGLWRDAEELMNAMLDNEIVPSSSCCSLLVSRYCNRRNIDFAIDLHTKVQNVNGILDLKTYNALIDGLMKEKRVEEANKVFDYMRTRQLMNSESYSIMVHGLSRQNDLRRAMKMHDEMLELGLKPNQKAYKRLILCFK